MARLLKSTFDSRTSRHWASSEYKRVNKRLLVLGTGIWHSVPSAPSTDCPVIPDFAAGSNEIDQDIRCRSVRLKGYATDWVEKNVDSGSSTAK